MKKFLAGILAFLIFSSSAFLSEGYLCFQNLKASIICKCNHTSTKENHSTLNENLIFPDHDLMNSSLEDLPSCHNPKKYSPHLCSCKKTSNTLSSILIQKSILYLENPFLNLLNLYRKDLLLSSYLYKNLQGFQFILTPPPKTI